MRPCSVSRSAATPGMLYGPPPAAVRRGRGIGSVHRCLAAQRLHRNEPDRILLRARAGWRYAGRCRGAAHRTGERACRARPGDQCTHGGEDGGGSAYRRDGTGRGMPSEPIRPRASATWNVRWTPRAPLTLLWSVFANGRKRSASPVATQLAECRKRASRQEARIAELLLSNSWRITTPLRRRIRPFPRPLTNDGGPAMPSLWQGGDGASWGRSIGRRRDARSVPSDSLSAQIDIRDGVGNPPKPSSGASGTFPVVNTRPARGSMGLSGVAPTAMLARTASRRPTVAGYRRAPSRADFRRAAVSCYAENTTASQRGLVRRTAELRVDEAFLPDGAVNRSLGVSRERGRAGGKGRSGGGASAKYCNFSDSGTRAESFDSYSGEKGRLHAHRRIGRATARVHSSA